MLDSVMRQNAVFDAAINENIEDARPDFDFEKTYNEIRGLEEKVVEILSTSIQIYYCVNNQQTLDCG